MIKLALFSSLPFLLPATCWATQCECDWLCPMFGPAGCIALAALAATGLFATLAFIQAMVTWIPFVTERRRLMKQAVRCLAITTALVAGPTLAHSDAQSPKKKAEMKQTEFGRTGDPRKANRTVSVDMSDVMRFTPAEISVKRGETVRFVVTNSGKQRHEMVLGTMKELKEHADLMKKHPGMQHDEPYVAHVAPGKKAEIVWQFTRPGEFHYGCLIPGHFEAGMVGKVVVAK